MYIVMKAARISSGWLSSDCVNSRAVPWNPPYTLLGAPMVAKVRSIAACAVDSDTPAGRLNEVVAAAKPPWWKIDSGVLDGAKLAIRVSGTVRPSAVTKLKSRRISGLCQ